jgi:hypothetical protein
MEKKAKQRKMMTLDRGRSALHYTDPLVDRFAATKTAQCIIHYSMHQHLPLKEDNSDCVLVQDSHNTSTEN